MAYTFSTDQQSIIDSRHQNILVSAAAGSGKTSVLTERIVGLVCDEKNPIDIDRVLVVTFTKAAAREMKERIGKRLLEKVRENPLDSHLARQATLIHNAPITTIDGFCLSVVKNHFTKIGIDPAFRTANDAELNLLKADIIKDIMKHAYASKDEDFYNLVDCYSKGENDDKIEDGILKLYNYAMSYPYPKQWLSLRKKDYEINSLEEFENGPIASEVKESIKLTLEDIISLVERTMKYCEKEAGVAGYAPSITTDFETLCELRDSLEGKSLSDISTLLQGYKFCTLKGKNNCFDELLIEYVQKIRSAYKDKFSKKIQSFLSLPMEDIYSDLIESGKTVCKMIELVEDFYDSLTAAKRDRGIIDFPDMEHMAINILVDEYRPDGSFSISDVAKSYKDFFAEVMVDEYQDSNLVQELIIKSVSREDDEACPNRFMVGDVKQSIYRFRLARPDIFVGKMERYKTDENAHDRLITLKKNFRSRQTVIDSVNAVFETAMTKRVGGIDYDADAMLYLGGTFTEDTPANKTEVLLVDTEENADASKEYEAELIARKIKETIESFGVQKGRELELRKAKYSDIAVLFRSLKSWRDPIKKAFDKYGIPFHLEGSGTLYDANEVREVLSFLMVLNNPLDDIACYAAMTSFFGGFTDEECARIKVLSGGTDRFFYSKVCTYAKNNPEDRKVASFLKRIDEYRRLSKVLPIYDLILRLYEETGIREAVFAKPDGEQRLANLNLLVTKAADYAKTSFVGLFNFLRYIELIKKTEQDEGEANILDENSNVVRVMSIHKSKGLEFPVVFVSGINGKYNESDFRAEFVSDIDFGVAASYINAKRRYKRATIKKHSINARGRNEASGEEIRILYVAMTRAKEKLYLTGSCKNAQDWFELPITTNSNSYLDLLKQPVVSDKDQIIFVRGTVNPQDILSLEVNDDINKLELKTDFERSAREADEALLKEFEERISFVYPFERLKKLYTKTTVSELKMAAIEREDDESAHPFEENEPKETIPSFAGGEAKTKGTDRGTAYHGVLELLDYKSFCDCADLKTELSRQLKAIEESGKFTADDLEKVNFGKLLKFVASDTAKLMGEADKNGQLFKEQPFVLGVSASLVEEDFPSDETVLVQGVIDVYYIIDNKVTVLDYKTDRVTTKEELIKRYKKQLEYYGTAVHTLTGLEVEKLMIYSFALNEAFVVE